MAVIESVKDFTSHQAARAIVKLLNSTTDDRLVQMTHWAEKIADNPEIEAGIRGVRNFLSSDHPSKHIFTRVLDHISVPQQVRLFESLFLNTLFQGAKKRDTFFEKHGFRPPMIMILSPTLHCNLRCKGCYTLGYGLKPELDFAVANDVIDQAEEMGIAMITFLGGEPMMYPHIFELIENHPNMFFQCYTNATLLNEEKAHRLAEAGNVLVVISIEGDEAETDSWRGPGVFKKIMHGFELLHDARALVGTSSTVTQNNVHKVSSFEFIDELISFGSLVHNYFLYIPVNGQADFNLMVTPEQRDLLRKQVLAIRNSKPIFMIDFWNDGPYVGGCIAGGRRYFHVNAKGDVEPCVYVHMAQDNIHDTTLAKALNSELFQTIRENQPHNMNQLRPCMIIDNPDAMRRIVSECSCHFTHPGAEEVYTDLADQMDSYAAKWGAFADKVWEEEYLSEERWQQKFGPDGKGFVDWHDAQNRERIAAKKIQTG